MSTLGPRPPSASDRPEGPLRTRRELRLRLTHRDRPISRPKIRPSKNGELRSATPTKVPSPRRGYRRARELYTTVNAGIWSCATLAGPSCGGSLSTIRFSGAKPRETDPRLKGRVPLDLSSRSNCAGALFIGGVRPSWRHCSTGYPSSLSTVTITVTTDPTGGGAGISYLTATCGRESGA